MITKILLFLAASLLILYISHRSLRVPGSHGSYRFFAWECILTLFLFNMDHWFTDFFSATQIVSWLLLFLSIIPLVFGVRSLVSKGNAVEKRDGEESLLAFEKTTQLVTTGIYHYIRHPLYSSLLLLTWGIYFKFPLSISTMLLVVMATVFLVLTARADEAECIHFFGDPYREYMKRSKRFIPYLI